MVDPPEMRQLASSRSTTGLLINFSGAPIHWKSIRQGSVTRSPTEAETVALCTAVDDAVWLLNSSVELSLIKDPGPIQIFCDNESAVKLAKNERKIQRTRHFKAKYAFLLEQVTRCAIDIIHVNSKYQLADMFSSILFRRLWTRRENPARGFHPLSPTSTR